MTDKNRYETVMLRKGTRECTSDDEFMLETIKLARKYTEDDLFELVRLVEEFAKSDNSPEMARIIDNVQAGAKIVLLVKIIIELLNSKNEN